MPSKAKSWEASFPFIRTVIDVADHGSTATIWLWAIHSYLPSQEARTGGHRCRKARLSCLFLVLVSPSPFSSSVGLYLKNLLTTLSSMPGVSVNHTWGRQLFFRSYRGRHQKEEEKKKQTTGYRESIHFAPQLFHHGLISCYCCWSLSILSEVVVRSEGLEGKRRKGSHTTFTLEFVEISQLLSRLRFHLLPPHVRYFLLSPRQPSSRALEVAP